MAVLLQPYCHVAHGCRNLFIKTFCIHTIWKVKKQRNTSHHFDFERWSTPNISTVRWITKPGEDALGKTVDARTPGLLSLSLAPSEDLAPMPTEDYTLASFYNTWRRSQLLGTSNGWSVCGRSLRWFDLVCMLWNRVGVSLEADFGWFCQLAFLSGVFFHEGSSSEWSQLSQIHRLFTLRTVCRKKMNRLK